MPALSEVFAKSILCKSGLSDYCINCYTGCLHGCLYCYARYMKRFTGHKEPWGRFLDIKINAPQILEKEVTHKKPARVFMSSVCDPYQPPEKRYKLSRECLKILVDSGFTVSILTKSKLVSRDFDIISLSNSVNLGLTLTTTDEQLRFRIEPGASPTRERIAILEDACSKGISCYIFLGPFMPGLSDTDEALDNLISAVAPLPLTHIYADKLNPSLIIWKPILIFLKRYYPDLIESYRRFFFDKGYYADYCRDLGSRLRKLAEEYGIGDKLLAGF